MNKILDTHRSSFYCESYSEYVSLIIFDNSNRFFFMRACANDWSQLGVIANMLDCDIVVSEFDLQSRY